MVTLKQIINSLLIGTALQFLPLQIKDIHSSQKYKQEIFVKPIFCLSQNEDNTVLFDLDSDGSKERISELPTLKIEDYNNKVKYIYPKELYDVCILEDNGHFFLRGSSDTSPDGEAIFLYWTGRHMYELKLIE